MTKPTKCKWATFPYVGKEMSDITNVFIQADLKIAFRTNNTIGARPLKVHTTRSVQVTLTRLQQSICWTD